MAIFSRVISRYGPRRYPDIILTTVWQCDIRFTRQMFKHWGVSLSNLQLIVWNPYRLLRVITNLYMSSNWKTIVHACVKGVNMWRWMSWRCLQFSCHLRLTNLDSRCFSVSLSLLACTVPSAVWVFPLFPFACGSATSNIWSSLVFYAVNPPWHGWPFKPYLENQQSSL